MKCKGNVDIKCDSGVKIISNVLLVPEIDQNLLVLHMEKNCSIFFKDKVCKVLDSKGNEMFVMKMKGKFFCLDWSHTNAKVDQIESEKLDPCHNFVVKDEEFKRICPTTFEEEFDKE